MQANRFTIKSQEAIAAAGSLAERRRNPQITPEHLLVVLLEQEDGVVVPVLGKLGANLAAVRSEANAALEALPRVSQGGESAGPSSELVRVLRDAEAEMRGLKDEYVSTEHILLALAGHPSKAGDALRAHGATKDALLQAIKEVRGPHRVTDQAGEDKYRALEKYGRDLTEEAENGKLDPVIGRDDEIRRVIQVLSRRTKNNPVLIGEPGVEDAIAILRGLKERYEVHHDVRIQDSALIAAATLSDRYISDRFLPDKAIDLIDEAAARLRIEIDSVPIEIDEVDRRVLQLEIELTSLQKEKDDASVARRDAIERELAELRERSSAMKAEWQAEKDAIHEVAAVKQRLEEARRELERASREGNLERAAQLRHGEIPELERRLAEVEEAEEP